jgi:hypothetical protein
VGSAREHGDRGVARRWRDSVQMRIESCRGWWWGKGSPWKMVRCAFASVWCLPSRGEASQRRFGSVPVLEHHTRHEYSTSFFSLSKIAVRWFRFWSTTAQKHVTVVIHRPHANQKTGLVIHSFIRAGKIF